MLTDRRAERVPLSGGAGRRPSAWSWLWVVRAVRVLPVLPPLVLLVLGGSLLLRRNGLWYDEAYTASVAPIPLGRLVRALAGGHGTIPYLRDAPPSYNAPYYAVIHGWLRLTGLPPDEVGLRLFSLLCAVVGVAVFGLAVARLAGRWVGLVAALIVAANPFVVQFSAEARGYSLTLLGVSVAAYGFTRWLDDEPGALWWYGAGAAAAGLAHWFAMLVPIGLAVAAVVLRGRGAGRFVAVTAAASVPVLGLVLLAVGNGVGASGAEWLRGVGGAAPWLVLRSWSGRSVWLVALTVGTAVAGLAGPRRQRRSARVVAAAWVGVPVAAVTAGELIRPVFVDRYLLAATVGLAVLMALGLSRLRGSWRVAGVAMVLAVSVAATAVDVGRPPKDDTKGAVAYIAAHQRRGEPVVAAARWDALGVDYYIHQAHAELADDLVLPGERIADAPTVWVVRRVAGGVKGDGDKLGVLDAELGARRLRVVAEARFDGRYADTLVQRWSR